jgi:hypothetical protein
VTIGTGSYSPSSGFWLIRAYNRYFNVIVDGVPVTQTINTFNFVDAGNPNVVFSIVVDPDFYFWNTNKRTMDRVISESYYIVLPSFTQIPMPFSLTYYYSVAAGQQTLAFLPFGLGFTTEHVFPMELAGSPYWADGTEN